MAAPRFDFSKDYVFENPIVRLSPLKSQHHQALAALSKEEAIWTYFLETGQGPEKLKTYIKAALQNRNQKQEYPFVIFDKRVNQYAGITRLYNYDQDLRIIKMGHTWFGKNFWGTKLNKHCKYLLFEFIFKDLNLERIGFGVHGENLRSVHALKNMGCQQEGMLRSFLPSTSGQGRVNLLLFSLLKNEWNTSVKNRLEKKLS